MPELDGTAATAAILEAQPETRVLLVSSLEPCKRLASAIRARAAGYVNKSASAAELCEAVHNAARGKSVMPAELMAVVSRNADPQLTTREMEVTQLVAHGLTDKDIAHSLCLAEITVRMHLRNIFGKLRTKNRVELTLYAIQAGWAATHCARGARH